MPVVDVPGMIGSSAKEETGKEWMSEAMADLGVVVPGMMSELAGKSMACYVTFEEWTTVEDGLDVRWIGASTSEWTDGYGKPVVKGKISGAKMFGLKVEAELIGMHYKKHPWFPWSVELKCRCEKGSNFSYTLDGVSGAVSSDGTGTTGMRIRTFKFNNFSAAFKEKIEQVGVNMPTSRKY
ncbi:TPA: hypothetical protein N4790_004064 [Shigella sonnei]|nr:hypothetical protein [Shigella sonnei]